MATEHGSLYFMFLTPSLSEVSGSATEEWKWPVADMEGASGAMPHNL